MQIEIANKLKIEFDTLLGNASDIWIAVATMSRPVHANLLKIIKGSDLKPKIIIGLDLLIEPYLLGEMLRMQKSNRAYYKVYKKTFYHPKLYIFKVNNELIAFVGSSNYTKGGTETHLELNLKIKNQDLCQKLLEWFFDVHQASSDLSEGIVESYKDFYSRTKERKKQIKLEQEDYNKNRLFDHSFVNYGSQFFKREHYEAFHPEKSKEDHIEERNVVRNLFLSIHDEIYPLFPEEWGIHPHHSGRHLYVSKTHIFRRGTEIRGIWLHYGRDKEEMARDTESSKFMRMQVILHYEDIGIWLRIGMIGGSREVREQLFENMKETLFRDAFYQLIQKLDYTYWIEVAGEKRFISSIESSEHLWGIVKKDKWKDHYFIIGCSILPDSEKLSKTNIVKTIMDHFTSLIPLYKMLKGN